MPFQMAAKTQGYKIVFGIVLTVIILYMVALNYPGSVLLIIPL